MWLTLRAPRPGGASRGGAAPPLLVVGLDGADWNVIDGLLEEGEMPHLASLIERGSRARLLSFQPMLSPVLWTTAATGVRPERHGVLDFVSVDPASGALRPVTSAERRVPAFWNILSGAGRPVGVTAWWATWPAEEIHGWIVSDRVAYQLFGAPSDSDPRGKTWPPELITEIAPILEEHADPPASRLEGYARGAEPDPAREPEAAEVTRQLRKLLASGDGYQAVAAHLAPKFHPEVEALYIETTDTIAHLAMRYRPPGLPGVDPALVERFGGAVDQAYRDADRALGVAMARAGPEANVLVLSDHGFRSGPDRPVSSSSRIEEGRAAEWHRKYGILVLAGPAILKGAEPREATLLDIAPTILALSGLPVPEHMEGRVLSEVIVPAFLAAHPLRTHSSASGAPAPAPAAGPAPAGAEEDEAVFEKLIALGYLGRESLNARNNRGILLMNQGKWAEAAAEFESALAARPAQPGVLANLGRCQWLGGDAAAGAATLRKAADLDPKATIPLVLLANIAMDQGNDQEAERRLRQALAIEPDDTEARNTLGILEEQRGRWEAAIAEYERVIAADPDHAQAYNNIGNVLKARGRPEEAESWYRKAIDADPTFFGSYNNLALVLQQRGAFDEAGALYRRALDVFGREPRIHNNLGSLLLAQGDTKGAIAEFETAAKLDPKFAEARNSLGVVFGEQGRRDEEIAEYREALRIDPRYADAHHNLALALFRRGETAAGKKELDEALRAEPRHVPSLILKSRVALEEGRPAEAKEYAARAARVDPRSAAARDALAAAGGP